MICVHVCAKKNASDDEDEDVEDGVEIDPSLLSDEAPYDSDEDEYSMDSESGDIKMSQGSGKSSDGFSEREVEILRAFSWHGCTLS